jgi:hypothetical protein
MLDEKGPACLLAARSPRRPTHPPWWPAALEALVHQCDAPHEGLRLVPIQEAFPKVAGL